jgi:hypothetical protein
MIAAFASILLLPKVEISFTKLFHYDKSRIISESMLISPDGTRFTYQTKDKKIIIDGKALGPFSEIKNTLFSGDSRECAFLAKKNSSDPFLLYVNGNYDPNNLNIDRLFRAGNNGPIGWFEVSPMGTRVNIKGRLSQWESSVERLSCNDNGSGFILSILAKKFVNGEQTSSASYYSFNGAEKVSADHVRRAYPSPDGKDFLLEYDYEPNGTYEFKSLRHSYNGLMKDAPIFSRDGAHAAIKANFTAASDDGNVERNQYVIDGKQITSIQNHEFFSFSLDSQDWYLIGKNKNVSYLLKKSLGVPIRVDTYTGSGATIKSIKITDKGAIILQQNRNSSPYLFVEGDKGYALPIPSIIATSLSVSPTSQYVTLSGHPSKKTPVYLYSLANMASPIELDFKDINPADITQNGVSWLTERSFCLLGTKGDDVYRIDIKIM